MGEFSQLQVWRDRALARSLAWYREVAENRMPAKFRIGATIPVVLSLDDAPEEALWRELERLTPVFLQRRAGIRERREALGARTEGPSLLDLCRALGYRMLAHCNFCRWNCRVDRTHGTKLGACKLAASSRVSTYFHHPGEELVYRGDAGSGTIFFTSCNMRCAFCQNGDISTDKDNGEVTDARTLAAMAWLLRADGAHNVNWVGGEVTIHLHTIVEAIALLGGGFEPSRADLARALPTKSDRNFWYGIDPEQASYDGAFNAPMLWNSNFFMTDEAMRILRLLTDVWLPDLNVRSWPLRHEPREDALVLGDGYGQPAPAARMGRGPDDPPPGHAQSRRVLHLSGAGLGRPAHARGARQRDGPVPTRQFLRSEQRQVPGTVR